MFVPINGLVKLHSIYWTIVFTPIVPSAPYNMRIYQSDPTNENTINLCILVKLKIVTVLMRRYYLN